MAVKSLLCRPSASPTTLILASTGDGLVGEVTIKGETTEDAGGAAAPGASSARATTDDFTKRRLLQWRTPLSSNFGPPAIAPISELCERQQERNRRFQRLARCRAAAFLIGARSSGTALPRDQHAPATSGHADIQVGIDWGLRRAQRIREIAQVLSVMRG